MELIIVTAGVLIALYLSNLKESNQARKYHKASIETISKEIKANYSDLKGVIEKQILFNDTLIKYRNTPIMIGKIVTKAEGLQTAELNNTGFDLYKRNQISSIDFEMISMLNQMNSASGVIDAKLNRLINFIYQNILDDSKESKLVLSVHIQDALGTEKQLLKLYKDYIDKNIDTKDNGN
jgi:hypothetical protein